jgi:type II secretory ATPase GspE/PulE/Tfp pilus assembly ATPase PilB-like protein
LAFEQLGLTEDQRLTLASLLAKPSGLLLVTGPSGSGKSTTLYSFLSKLNTGHANIVTIEDPVEYELAGVTQIPVQPQAGLTVADGLRAIPHHNPDIVMVSELEDQEAASLAVRTALTGHLVLSSLHTNDASKGITRLLDLRVEPFFLCSTVTGILSQRLIRKLCTACREPYVVEAVSVIHLGVSLPKETGAVPVWRAKGCTRCRDTGFYGRTGVFELLVVDHQIRSLIIKRTSGAQIRQSAISRGMMSLPQAVWHKVQAGVTSLHEFIRVLPPEQTGI